MAYYKRKVIHLFWPLLGSLLIGISGFVLSNFSSNPFLSDVKAVNENVILRVDADPQTPGIQTCRSVSSTAGPFTVDVVIENVTDLKGFQFNFLYNRNVFSLTNFDAKQFLASLPGNNISISSDSLPDSVGNFLVSAVDDGLTGPDGSGIILRVTLNSVAPGSSNLQLLRIILAQTNGQNISPTAVNAGQLVVNGSCPAPQNDTDGDTVFDDIDNCPTLANDQRDFDRDGLGDPCDPDDDNDGILDTVDNCPTTANPGQENLDQDAWGDVCDSDADSDGQSKGIDQDDIDDDTDEDGLIDGCFRCGMPDEIRGEDQNNDGRIAGDTNNDGIMDPGEIWTETRSGIADTENDGLNDGLEKGRTSSQSRFVAPGKPKDTNFTPDQDPSTTTNPLAADSDNDGLGDGAEDTNKNGKGDKDAQNNFIETNAANPDTDSDIFSDGPNDPDGPSPIKAGDNCKLKYNRDQQNIKPTDGTPDNDAEGDVCDPDTPNSKVSDPSSGSITLTTNDGKITFTGTTTVAGATVTVLPSAGGAGTITACAGNTCFVAYSFKLISSSNVNFSINMVVDFNPGISQKSLDRLEIKKQQATGEIILCSEITKNPACVVSKVITAGGIVQATVQFNLIGDADILTQIPADSDNDGVFDNFDLGGGNIERDNCPTIPNPTQTNTDKAIQLADTVAPIFVGDDQGDLCDADNDNDGFLDTLEAYLGTNPLKPCGAGNWPLDLFPDVPGGLSYNKVDIQDVASFIAPIRYLGTNVGTNSGDIRWDLVPGKGILTTDINVQDMAALIGGPTGFPPMLGGVRAYNMNCPVNP